MILTVLFILLTLAVTPSAVPDMKTEIVVIGTVHYSTNNYNSDTLLNILNKINPDLILVECDSSYMTSDFQLKEDIQYSFLETRAITKYKRTNKVDLRPYDITGRDLFLNDRERIANESNFFNDVRSLSGSEKLNIETTNMLNNILSMMNTANVMSNSSAMYINNIEGSQKIDTINYYTYEGFNILINSLAELSPYKIYWNDVCNFWEKRNKTMLDNILYYEKMYEGKKIVVLCGFGHKNILKNGLKEKEDEENIIVKEYWEI